MFKRRGFTDKLYFMNWIMAMVTTQECLIIVVLSLLLGITDWPQELISTALTCVFAELTVHTGFIIWKAKAENKSKFAKKGIEVKEENEDE